MPDTRRTSTPPLLRLAGGIALREAADGVWVLDVEPGASVPLNDVAVRILALCDGTRRPADIAAAVSGGAGQARADVLEFLSAAGRMRWVVGDDGRELDRDDVLEG